MAKPIESKMAPPNHLILEKSPYLLQHAYNPVDWYPWAPEAFEKAKREDKPIFLSIGYSTGHYVIPQTVRIATPVPKALMLYTRRFEDILKMMPCVSNRLTTYSGQDAFWHAACLYILVGTPVHEVRPYER